LVCHDARSLVARAFGVDEAVLAKSLDDIEVAEQRDERALSSSSRK
jgi:hypothetical protein